MQGRKRGNVNTGNPFRLGKKENYVNDHELYELLRSRELFRLQLELRKSLKRQLRGLADTQKVTMATLAAKKRIFIHQASSKNKSSVLNVEEELQIIESQISNFLLSQDNTELEKEINELMEPKAQPKPMKFTRERIFINPCAEDLIDDSFIQRSLNPEQFTEYSTEAIAGIPRWKHRTVPSHDPSEKDQFHGYNSENVKLVKKENKQKELDERVKYFVLHGRLLTGEK